MRRSSPSISAQISCPRCERAIPEGKRVCRACYAVVPSEAALDMRKLSKTRAWIIVTAQILLITPVVAGLAWVIAPSLFISSDAQAGSTEASSKSIFSTLQSRIGAIQPDPTKITDTVRTNLANSQIARTDNVCRATHRIENIGPGPIQRISILFDLVSKSGAALGRVVGNSEIVNLAPGEQRAVNFTFKCPETIAQATAQLTADESEEHKIALIGTNAPQNSLQSTDRFSQLAVPLSGVEICPGEPVCELDVRINEKSTLSVRFRRDSRNSELITSTNQLLIGHLGANYQAMIEYKNGDETILIPLDQSHLMRMEKPGYFSRLWARLFSAGDQNAS
jgi:hypothetical protein